MTELNYTVEFSLLEPTSEDEAFAAVSLNPAVTWAKFILTDDQANANRQRVPASEFSNIIRTGTFMPIKMAEGKINDGHAGATPIGVVSHLKQVNNQIHGLAALWDRERPEDVKLIKDRYANKEQLQMSWELLYANSSLNEDGVTDLLNVNLRAVTVVGIPAYSGRTPITAVASDNSANTEENKLELEQLQAELATAQSALTSKDEELAALKTELEELRSYKASVEEAKASAEKLANIKEKFSAAGLDKGEDFYAEKRDMLFSLSSEALDFMIQEMVAFASANPAPKAEGVASTQVPPIVKNHRTEYTTEELAKALRARLQK